MALVACDGDGSHELGGAGRVGAWEEGRGQGVWVRGRRRSGGPWQMVHGVWLSGHRHTAFACLASSSRPDSSADGPRERSN